MNNPIAEKRGIYLGPGETVEGVFIEHGGVDYEMPSCFRDNIKVTVYRVGMKQEARLLTDAEPESSEAEKLKAKPIAVAFYNTAYIPAAHFKRHGILEVRHEATGTIFYEDWTPLGRSDWANLKANKRRK